MLIYLQQHYLDDTRSLTEALDDAMADLAASGFDHLTGFRRVISPTFADLNWQ